MGMSHVYFVSGGSEAMEAAMKMARQYFVETGRPQRTHFIARRQSYHGNTLGALAVGGNQWRREPFAPILIPVSHLSPCYPYREQRGNETPEQYGQRLAQELEAEIQRLGSDSVIAFVAETVGGATAGVLVPVPGYFKAVREVCDRHGVLLILDEVMCGMGRTGRLHACDAEGVVPDIMAIAKGLGGGYQPIGAVLAHRRIVEAIRPAAVFSSMATRILVTPWPALPHWRCSRSLSAMHCRRACASGHASGGLVASRAGHACQRRRYPRPWLLLGRRTGARSCDQSSV